MIDSLTEVTPDRLAGFDDIIDVRSPAEFAADHMPGAINLPVLDDTERAEVGTLYIQDSPFIARRRGAALIARNIGRHLERTLSTRLKTYRPLIYCWRGGQRSRAFATVLDQIGWRVTLVDGGYKTWRRQVVDALYQEGRPLPFILLDGQTGSAKTALLHRLAAAGIQILDLEGRANHKGSVFGGDPAAPQPGQKAFESRLYTDLWHLDTAKPIVVEAESALIGKRRIPPRLWAAMGTAPRIELTVPRPMRASYLVTAYGDLLDDRTAFAAAIGRLKPFHGKARIAAWREDLNANRLVALAESLTELHYDPLYNRARRTGGPVTCFAIDDLSSDGLAEAARRLIPVINEIAGRVSGRPASAGPEPQSDIGAMGDQRAG